jgi:phosphoglycolate phosphatase-like HAD superfamily hydrolase
VPVLTFGTSVFDADLVVFDKDGTLTDFEFLWGRVTAAWLERLSGQMDGQSPLRELCALMGYDYDRRASLPESPMVVASQEQLCTIAAAVLYRHGIPWPQAEARALEAFAETTAAMPLPGLIRALGDVAGLMDRLAHAGVRLGVVTIDDRSRTADILRILGIAHRIDVSVCGDDGLPWKPAPDMLLAVCARLTIDPARTVVVGDTWADMQMARGAGAGLAVAVLTGMGDPAQLGAHADVVLSSVDDIEIGDADPRQ